MPMRTFGDEPVAEAAPERAVTTLAGASAGRGAVAVGDFRP